MTTLFPGVCIAIGESVITLSPFGALKKGGSPYRAFVPGMFLGILPFGLMMPRNLLILGADLWQAVKFSSYRAVRIIKAGNFLERVESSISFVYVLPGITKLSLYLMAASMGIARPLGSGSIVVPPGLLLMALSAVLFQNRMKMDGFVWVYRFLCLSFQLVIP